MRQEGPFCADCAGKLWTGLQDARISEQKVKRRRDKKKAAEEP